MTNGEPAGGKQDATPAAWNTATPAGNWVRTRRAPAGSGAPKRVRRPMFCRNRPVAMSNKMLPCTTWTREVESPAQAISNLRIPESVPTNGMECGVGGDGACHRCVGEDGHGAGGGSQLQIIAGP